MGLFENLGRKVERFKQAAEDAAEEEASHRCEACGEPYYTEQDACPECGGDVVAVEPAREADAEPTEESATTDATTDDESDATDESVSADGSDATDPTTADESGAERDE